MADQCCKTCVHSRWQLTPTCRIKKDMHGTCVAEFIEPVLPACIVRPVYSRTAIWPDKGSNCPLWEENEHELQGDIWSK